MEWQLNLIQSYEVVVVDDGVVCVLEKLLRPIVEFVGHKHTVVNGY